MKFLVNLFYFQYLPSQESLIETYIHLVPSLLFEGARVSRYLASFDDKSILKEVNLSESIRALMLLLG